MKLTAPLAQALTNLRGSKDFAVVMEGMAEHKAEETQRCVEHEGSIQLRASGAVKTIQQWQDFFRDAPAVTEKLKSQQGK